MILEFDKYIKKIDTILRLIGMSITREDIALSTFQRLKYHWMCSVNLFIFNIAIIGQLIWLVMGIVTGKSLLQITYLLPCVTLCMVGSIKIFSFIHYVQHIHDVILSLRALDYSTESRAEITGDDLKKIWLKFLNNVYLLLCLLTATGAAAFALGPFVIMASYYYTTGEIKLFLPFILWYPFDEFQIRTWPFVYIHQMWAGKTLAITFLLNRYIMNYRGRKLRIVYVDGR